MAEVSNWTESGRGPRFAALCRQARGQGINQKKPMEWEAITGIGRMRWSRYEDGASPRGIGELMQVADILGMSLIELVAALDDKPAAPAGESMEDWAAKITDLDFRQLCQLQDGDRIVRWISIAAQVLASKNTEDSPNPPG
jgi:hypothetical protein